MSATKTSDNKKPTVRRRIVLAVDGSEYSENALKWFIDKVHKPDDYVIAVHVPEYKSLTKMPVMTTDAAMVTRMIGEEQNKAKLFLGRIKETMKSNHVDGNIKQFSGEPGQKIVEVARLEGADFIVTGSRGLGAIRRTLLGSVSDYIVHHSDVPVLICRLDDTLF